MKILFLLDSLIAGGKERRALELMKGIKSNPDIEFKLVLMNEEIHYTDVFNLDIIIHYLIRSTKKDLSVFCKFYKICRQFRPDIVHCWDSMTAVYAVPVCSILKIKLVNGMVIDTPVRRNFSNKEWFRAQLTFPFSTKVIGNSNAGLKAYGAPKKKSLCIYNGLDLKRFKYLTDRKSLLRELFGVKKDDFFVVGMVAAFAERKDYRTLVKAALQLISLNESYRFVLVGDGPDLSKIKSMVPSSLLFKINFLGKRSNVESIINVFDVGVLLTNSKVHGEGISNSIIEYMALAKPVIATSGGGTNEVVFDEQNGYLIDPENEVQLVEKIEILRKNRPLAQILGNHGLQMVSEKFDLKIMTRNYLSLYTQLINKSRNK